MNIAEDPLIKKSASDIGKYRDRSRLQEHVDHIVNLLPRSRGSRRAEGGPSTTCFESAAIENTNQVLPESPKSAEKRQDAQLLCKLIRRIRSQINHSQKSIEDVIRAVLDDIQSVQSIIGKHRWDSDVRSEMDLKQWDLKMIRIRRPLQKTVVKKRTRSIAYDNLECHSCGTKDTPEWRRGPDGSRTLCNACGLHYAKLIKKNPTSNITVTSITKNPPAQPSVPSLALLSIHSSTVKKTQESKSHIETKETIAIRATSTLCINSTTPVADHSPSDSDHDRQGPHYRHIDSFLAAREAMSIHSLLN